MNEENKTSLWTEQNEEQHQNHRKRISWRAKLALACICVMMAVPSASATSESSSGLDAVLAQSTNATTLIGAAFDLITGNAYLALLCFFGLLGVAIRLFRRGKRAAR